MPQHKPVKQYCGNGYENRLSGCLGVFLFTHPDQTPRLKIEYSCTSPLPLDLLGLCQGAHYLIYLLPTVFFSRGPTRLVEAHKTSTLNLRYARIKAREFSWFLSVTSRKQRNRNTYSITGSSFQVPSSSLSTNHRTTRSYIAYDTDSVIT